MIEKPQILTLSLTSKTNFLLQESNYNVYVGSLGKLVDTNNSKFELKYCLLNNDFPPNIHEFDIVIIDLSNEEHIPYQKIEHIRKDNITKNNTYLLCEYPQTIFDPRAYSSFLLSTSITELLKRESIIIVIQDENILSSYELVEENGSRPIMKGKKEYDLYSFLPNLPYILNKYGKETKVVIKSPEFKSFLEKYNPYFSYKSIFKHPTIWKDEERIADPEFFPLVCNKDDEIVSFAYFENKYGLYLFPCLEDNSQFILEFLQTIAPSIQPNIFPFSTENIWTNQQEYCLPNRQNLLTEKQLIEEEFNLKIKQKNIEIDENQIKYQFLHDILTETGDDLVKSVIKYLEWLGFEDIKDVDGEITGQKEEDIQIETDRGLLVIEVKGIGGTSKDSECSQISKIKYRRAKERGKFDVFGLYLVNHQRHLPPMERENPPFTKDQVQDATNDERGLLTTWQLFNLYFDVQNHIITKEEARTLLCKFGHVTCHPINLVEIDSVKETFLDGFVSILNISGINLKVGDELFVEKNSKFQIAKIIEIKIDDKPVKSVSEGEIGIKTDIKIIKKSKIYKKNLP